MSKKSSNVWGANTWGGRCALEEEGCANLGWLDLSKFFRLVGNKFENKQYKEGRRLFDLGAVELQRRLDASLGRTIHALPVSTQYELELLGVACFKSSGDVELTVPVTEIHAPVPKPKKKARSKDTLREPVSHPLPGIPRKRGRPEKPDALSNSERQKLYRERKKLKFKDDVDAFAAWDDQQLLTTAATKTKLAIQCWIEYGRRRGWVADDLHLKR